MEAQGEGYNLHEAGQKWNAVLAAGQEEGTVEAVSGRGRRSGSSRGSLKSLPVDDGKQYRMLWRVLGSVLATRLHVSKLTDSEVAELSQATAEAFPDIDLPPWAPLVLTIGTVAESRIGEYMTNRAKGDSDVESQSGAPGNPGVEIAPEF